MIQMVNASLCKSLLLHLQVKTRFHFLVYPARNRSLRCLATNYLPVWVTAILYTDRRHPLHRPVSHPCDKVSQEQSSRGHATKKRGRYRSDISAPPPPRTDGSSSFRLQKTMGPHIKLQPLGLYYYYMVPRSSFCRAGGREGG